MRTTTTSTPKIFPNSKSQSTEMLYKTSLTKGNKQVKSSDLAGIEKSKIPPSRGQTVTSSSMFRCHTCDVICHSQQEFKGHVDFHKELTATTLLYVEGDKTTNKVDANRKNDSAEVVEPLSCKTNDGPGGSLLNTRGEFEEGLQISHKANGNFKSEANAVFATHTDDERFTAEQLLGCIKTEDFSSDTVDIDDVKIELSIKSSEGDAVQDLLWEPTSPKLEIAATDISETSPLDTEGNFKSREVASQVSNNKNAIVKWEAADDQRETHLDVSGNFQTSESPLSQSEESTNGKSKTVKSNKRNRLSRSKKVDTIGTNKTSASLGIKSDGVKEMIRRESRSGNTSKDADSDVIIKYRTRGSMKRSEGSATSENLVKSFNAEQMSEEHVDVKGEFISLENTTELIEYKETFIYLEAKDEYVSNTESDRDHYQTDSDVDWSETEGTSKKSKIAGSKYKNCKMASSTKYHKLSETDETRLDYLSNIFDTLPGIKNTPKCMEECDKECCFEYMCAQCTFHKKVFRTLDQLKEHYNREHELIKSFCRGCGHGFRWVQELEVHLTSCSLLYAHSLYNKKFKNKAELAIHTLTNGLQCEQCSQECFSIYELRKHMKQVHQKTNEKTRSGRNSEGVNGVSNTAEVRLNDIKPVTSRRTINIATNLEEESNIVLRKEEVDKMSFEYLKNTCRTPPDIKSKSTCVEKCKKECCFDYCCFNCKQKTYFKTYSELKGHYKKNHRYVICFCQQCGCGCQRFSRLKQHLYGHAGLFACYLCDESFITENEFAEHKETHKVKCKECGKIMGSLGTLREHIFYSHQKTRKHKCQVCDKEFLSSAQLRGHRNTYHSFGEFQCDQCSTVYKTKKGFDSHKYRKHGKHTKRICEDCGTECSSTKALYSHRRMHSVNKKVYECSECNKVYKTFNARKDCMSRHKGIPAYKCDQCDKAFYYNYSLIVHKRLHSGEKPYQCFACDRRFYTRQILYKHCLSHDIPNDEIKLKLKDSYKPEKGNDLKQSEIEGDT